MENLIEVRGLCKRYRGFSLDRVDLTVPAGMIVGLIGENGAGKTTTIKAVLNVIRPDAGTVRLLGRDPSDPRARAGAAAVFEDSYFYGGLTPKQVGSAMAGICREWDGALFRSCCGRFGLDWSKPLKEFSRGMRMKLSLATALARRPRLRPPRWAWGFLRVRRALPSAAVYTAARSSDWEFWPCAFEKV